jgi:hypothetical protein
MHSCVGLVGKAPLALRGLRKTRVFDLLPTGRAGRRHAQLHREVIRVQCQFLAGVSHLLTARGDWVSR